MHINMFAPQKAGREKGETNNDYYFLFKCFRFIKMRVLNERDMGEGRKDEKVLNMNKYYH